MPEWESISSSRSNFIGWAAEIGQNVTGKVLSVGAGKDVNGVECPELQIEVSQLTETYVKGQRSEFEAGTVVTLTCGLSNLKKQIAAAQLRAGDLVNITLESLYPTAKSPAKIFNIKVARGAAPVAPEPAADPWGAAQPSFAGFSETAEIKPAPPF
jgi:hypothetical protein